MTRAHLLCVLSWLLVPSRGDALEGVQWWRAVGGRSGAKACFENLPVLPTPLGPLQEGKLP